MTNSTFFQSFPATGCVGRWSNFDGGCGWVVSELINCLDISSEVHVNVCGSYVDYDWLGNSRRTLVAVIAVPLVATNDSITSLHHPTGDKLFHWGFSPIDGTT